MPNNRYKKQVELILQVLPEIFKKDCFALKGGTAINFFIRDMPRLSVDIDLVYLPKEPRDIFLQNLTISLQELAGSIEQNLKGSKIQKTYDKGTNYLSKFVVYRDFVNIKVEANVVLRESILDCESRDLCKKAQDDFLQFTKANTQAFAELYAGKICAALDRQHPRDLFDVKLLLENEGFTPEIRKIFIIYLASGSRPINELLGGNQLNIKPIYEAEFLGMTNPEVTYEELIDVRTKLGQIIHGSLTENERKFLLSIKCANPDWELIDIANVENFPALKWKLHNIKKMDKAKWKKSVGDLKRVLDL
ncbi:MAG: nucleotidyl transferase AbiEii/AbiGii toxin family protein [Gammaproteobacteria bacterium]|nr:nucleotidyl transferase AbiEii/AbiGii toxin family protein [Gammaproteobacteria bacterium]